MDNSNKQATNFGGVLSRNGEAQHGTRMLGLFLYYCGNFAHMK